MKFGNEYRETAWANNEKRDDLLSIAYSSIGEDDKAEVIIKKNYEQNPDYLFAKCNYAEICFHRGQIEKIPEIFNNKFDLKLLYPKRKRFHISEL